MPFVFFVVSSSLPLRLYIHIPFCARKCHYCDFNSHVRASPPWTDYQAALLAELSHWAQQPQFAGRPLASLFFGGGTPSLAPAGLISAVIAESARLFGHTPDIEISLEANPGTVEASHFADFRAAGINRLSIGVQSFDDDELAWLERIHSAAEAEAAFAAARRAGFTNLNLDLMFALPGQSLSEWFATLDRAISLAPEHLSCYQLTIEEQTQLAARHRANPIAIPVEEEAVDFLLATRKRLTAAGYPAYEISNFSRPGHHCRHNDGYWRYDDYIGIGAGAAGKWDAADGGVVRYSNLRAPESYLKATSEQGSAIASSERLDRRQAMAEALWLALRRTEGCERSAFRNRFGIDPCDAFAPRLQRWLAQGALQLDAQKLALGDSGIALADEIAADLF